MPKLKNEAELRAQILELRGEGASYSEIAKELDVSRGFVRTTLRSEEPPLDGEPERGDELPPPAARYSRLRDDDAIPGRMIRALVVSQEKGKREVSMGFLEEGQWLELLRVEVDRTDTFEIEEQRVVWRVTGMFDCETCGERFEFKDQPMVEVCPSCKGTF